MKGDKNRHEGVNSLVSLTYHAGDLGAATDPSCQVVKGRDARVHIDELHCLEVQALRVTVVVRLLRPERGRGKNLGTNFQVS